MSHRVLTVGALNLDILAAYVSGDQGQPPWGGDLEKEVDDRDWWRYFYSYLNGRPIQLCAGGSAANTGAALAALAPEFAVHVVGVVGDDAEADFLVQRSQWYGAKLLATPVPHQRTGRALSYVRAPREERRLAVAPGANDLFRADLLADSLLLEADWLHVSSFTKPLCNAEIGELFRRARQTRGDRIVLSIDPGTFLSKDGLTKEAVACISESDVVFTKTAELAALTHQPDTQTEESARLEAAECLFALAKRRLCIVVERLPNGYTVYRSGTAPETITFERAAPLTVLDDTGAGDVFNAAYIFAHLKLLPVKATARLIASIVRVHLGHIGRSGFTQFAHCAPVVFASHSRKDKPYVDKFIRHFEGSEIAFWVDENEISLGSSLAVSIQEGIRKCDALAVFITEDSLDSGWVQRELDWAKGRGVRVLPIRLAPADVPNDLRDLLYLDVVADGFLGAAEKMKRDFRRSAPLPGVP